MEGIRVLGGLEPLGEAMEFMGRLAIVLCAIEASTEGCPEAGFFLTKKYYVRYNLSALK